MGLRQTAIIKINFPQCKTCKVKNCNKSFKCLLKTVHIKTELEEIDEFFLGENYATEII